MEKQFAKFETWKKKWGGLTGALEGKKEPKRKKKE